MWHLPEVESDLQDQLRYKNYLWIGKDSEILGLETLSCYLTQQWRCKWHRQISVAAVGVMLVYVWM